MELMIIDESKILVDYTLDYERIIGCIENPTYRDIKFDVYIDDEHQKKKKRKGIAHSGAHGPLRHSPSLESWIKLLTLF